MTDQDKQYVFPLVHQSEDFGNGITGHFCSDFGLTRRDLFAAMVLQGFAANPARGLDAGYSPEWAVVYADALIAHLDKE